MPVPISKLRRWGALATALLLVSGALAACGGGGGSSSTSSSSPSSASGSGASTGASTTAQSSGSGSSMSGGATLAISATESGGLGFSQRALTARAGTVTIKLANGSSDALPHGIAIEGNGVDRDGKIVQPGGTSTVTVRLKPGRYTFYCPVPGHEDQGMKGTLTVS